MSRSRVSIVDDNRPNAELAEFVLENDDFLIDSAVDAEQALKCCVPCDHVPVRN